MATEHHKGLAGCQLRVAAAFALLGLATAVFPGAPRVGSWHV
jgi:hypothetical protein